MTLSSTPIESLETRLYKIPTEQPEADGPSGTEAVKLCFRRGRGSDE